MFEDLQPIDPDRVMQSARPFFEEVSNKLNEQNFHARAFNDPEQLDHDAVYEWRTARVVAPVQSMSPPGDNSLGFSIRDVWQPFGLFVTIVTQGAWVMVSASFQVEMDGVGSVTPNAGAMFALSLDGNIIVESIVGSVEEDQDVPTTGIAVDAALTPGEGWVNFLAASASPIKGAQPINLHWVGFLTEGSHTFDIQIKPIGTVSGIPAESDINVGSRELIVLEIKK